VSTLEFYMNRAEQCAVDAEETALINVRERHLRARDAWLAMAEKLELTTNARAQAMAEKSAAEQAAVASRAAELAEA
jgi:hypothetical protein